MSSSTTIPTRLKKGKKNKIDTKKYALELFVKHRFIPLLLALCMLVVLVSQSHASSWPKGTAFLITKALPGTASENDWSGSPSISADGRYIAFVSRKQLVPEDQYIGDCAEMDKPVANCRDVYVYDRFTGKLSLASLNSSGEQADYKSYLPKISANGRFVVFESFASNLDGRDNNDMRDVFVRDLQANRTEMVSVSSSGVAGDNNSHFGDISGDGRYVVFVSTASNFAPDANNPCTGPYPWDESCGSDVFIHDRLTHTTDLVSKSSAGVQGNGNSTWASISRDGRFITFHSNASNLVPGDDNQTTDIFVFDRVNKTTVLQGSPEDQSHANDPYTVFSSSDSDLVPGDTNGFSDIFARSTSSGEVTRVSVATDGSQANGDSTSPSISPDGRYIRFISTATNLSIDDPDPDEDIYYHDMQTGKTYLVSYRYVTEYGYPFTSAHSAFSDNGLFIAIGDYYDVYFVDLLTPDLQPAVYLPSLFNQK